MKRVGIITPYGNNNFGNKLQNYALQELIQRYGFDVCTLINYAALNSKKKFIFKYFKNLFVKESVDGRVQKFIDFNENINYSSKKYTVFSDFNEFDYLVVGSDQVWNPFHGRLSDVDLLSNVDSKKRISYAASFGISSLPEKFLMKTKSELLQFKNISVREDSGKSIIEKLTSRTDVKVIIDPTLMLSANDWDEIAKMPEMYDGKKYILNYFLGELSSDRYNSIKKIADENNYEIINILDPNCKYYCSGPSEFLWLEKNAELICTDSFHSSVFAIIYDRPFVVFSRGDNSMSSRIETLISKFKLKNREYNGDSITKENIKHNYSEAYIVLEEEKKKAENFLRKALDL